MVKEIPLSLGRVALVDAADYEALAKYRWYAMKTKRDTYYAWRSEVTSGRRGAVLMHRAILAAPKGLEVDHANGNGLDNRRENIRLATRSQNMANRGGWGSTSGFKGVYKCSWLRGKPRPKPWKAEITQDGKQIDLGRFRTPEMAARAYDAAAVKLFGAFARLNFPDAAAAA